MAAPEESPQFDLSDRKVQDLRQLSVGGIRRVQQAHLAYEHALSIAGNLPSANDLIALQRAWRDYAPALSRHSHVLMAWLAMVDRSRSSLLRSRDLHHPGSTLPGDFAMHD